MATWISNAVPAGASIRYSRIDYANSPSTYRAHDAAVILGRLDFHDASGLQLHVVDG